ncbi:MAG: T9SS type A sorting domain-containing protein [Bacteroidota bacterium]
MKKFLPLLLSIFCFSFVGAQNDVTFTVDMSDYGSSFSTVYISGSFNSWDGGANPLTDNGDGTWSTTISFADGDYEYKFQVDQWNDQESLVPGGACVLTTGNYTNRFLTVAGAPINQGTACWGSCDACGVGASSGDITVTVDMSEYGGSFSTVYLSGQFNSWSGDSNPMTDNGDGTWSVTVNMPGGPNEYKFQVDQWSDDESLNQGSSCTVSNGGYTNRFIQVDGNATVDPVCWASCSACGQAVTVDITFNVNTEFITVDPSGLWLAGGAIFGAPGTNPAYQFQDPDQDGVYSLTITVEENFTSFYTFTNGACADFNPNCKENIAGQACANPGNFNDREIINVTQDTTINTCFAECSTDGTCTEPIAPVDVTYRVNMSEVTGFNIVDVRVFGTFNGFDPNVTVMTDMGNGIWEVTLNQAVTTYEYKFIAWDGTNFLEETLADGSSCTVTAGEFTNRVVNIVAGQPNDLGEVCFESCDACTVGLETVSGDEALFSLFPTLVQNQTFIRFSNLTSEAQLEVFGANGQQVYAAGIAAGTSDFTLNTTDLANGVYFVAVRTDRVQSIQRIVVNR